MTKSFSAPLELITVTHQKKAHWEFIPNTKKKTKKPRDHVVCMCLIISDEQFALQQKWVAKVKLPPVVWPNNRHNLVSSVPPRREGSGSQITTSGTVSHFPPKTQKISCCALVEKGQMVEKAPRSPRQTQQCCLSCRHWSWSSNRKQWGRPSAGVEPWPYLWPCADIDDGPGLSDIFFWIKFCAKLSVLLQCGLVHDTHVFVHLITSDCGSNSDSLCQAF